jgi:hypothetical protein
MFIDRPSDGKPSIHQCAFWNYRMFNDVDTIDTNELWRPVKDSDGSTRWESVARSDDWVKLIWMAKFHAQDIEVTLARYPGIRNVMVGGSDRPAPYVLVETTDEMQTKDHEAFLDELYEHEIVGVNNTTAKVVAIPRETVLMAKKDKPMKLTSKQLVNRREVEKDYAEEIEAAYQRLEQLSPSEILLIAYCPDT